MVVAYGTEIEKITYETLAASDISRYLKADFSVAIKPNLVVPRPASDGATTHPEVVAGILRFLQDFGVAAGKISIVESSCIGDDTRHAFRACGYEPLREKYGVSLFDLKEDSCEKLEYGGVSMEICRRVLETDFLINVPVLKSHCQTRLTCNMKNLKGCIPDKEKRRFHTIGLHKPIAALNALVKTGYCVVDGICGDLTFEEGGNPFYANRVIAGRDPVTVDSFCAELIGYRPTDIEYLKIAQGWGLGEFFSPETSPITELFADNKPATSLKNSTRLAARHEKSITQNSACSACYAALIFALHRTGGANTEICIGQGFTGKTKANALGIGNCTCGFKNYVVGCPPKATDIIDSLSKLLSKTR
ncbi:MAG: DUF362 domain-containing protein [Defluviitaleaceae bacterium]|nr:DUF362 domain-containing protein [Defluviitaleaceae bacterium]MCL2263414.1 DUF362 domain-containing protein [Defluviitaleaceae bacterium]